MKTAPKCGWPSGWFLLKSLTSGNFLAQVGSTCQPRQRPTLSPKFPHMLSLRGDTEHRFIALHRAVQGRLERRSTGLAHDRSQLWSLIDHANCLQNSASRSAFPAVRCDSKVTLGANSRTAGHSRLLLMPILLTQKLLAGAACYLLRRRGFPDFGHSSV